MDKYSNQEQQGEMGAGKSRVEVTVERLRNEPQPLTTLSLAREINI